MRAIDHHFQPVEADVACHRLLHRVDIAAARILDPAGAADPGGLDQQRFLFEQAFDRCLGVVGQLEPVGTEQLDAIVLERVVAGGDHHAQIGAHLAGQQRDRRGRQRPGHDHVHADTGEARDQRAFHHIARQARVLADHHPVTMPAAQEMRPRRLADAHGGGGGHHALVGASADAVRAEEFACHLRAVSLCRLPHGAIGTRIKACPPPFSHTISALCATTRPSRR